jgi:hypothetical protein
VFEQKGEGVVDGLGFDEVVVVEDEDKPIGDGGDIVDQRSQDSLGRRQLRGLKHTQRSLPDVAGRFLPGLNGLQGSDEIGQEANGVVVALVERYPGDGYV